jgi:hypothetical protein
MMKVQRILIVQLADIGDFVLSTPALSALREAHPGAHIAVLTTAHAAPILAHTRLVDDVLTFDKHTFDSPAALLRPGNLRRALMLSVRLRKGSLPPLPGAQAVLVFWGWIMARASSSPNGCLIRASGYAIRRSTGSTWQHAWAQTRRRAVLSSA